MTAMDHPATDFVIVSNGLCFFCLDEIDTEPEPGEESISFSTLNSLQYFSRFLQMDMGKVFLAKEDIPVHLMAKVEMSRLKAHLCAKCALLNETFSKLCRRLLKIEMEVMASLENIYSELLKSGSTNEHQKVIDPLEDSDDEWKAKFGIMEVIRKEAVQKCSITLQKSRPRVRVSNLSKSAISKMKQKFKVNSRKLRQLDIGHKSGIKAEPDETLSEPSFNDPDMDYQSDFGIDGENPPSPAIYDEKAVVKNIEKEGRGIRLLPRISENIEKIQLTGQHSAQQKYRCRLCKKVFSQTGHASRHVKCVHLNERSFQCPECFKAFSRKDFMQIHMRTHSGLKPHKCHICPKHFRQVHHLKIHLLVHSATTPNHKCRICGYVFSHKTSLTRHARRKHSKHGR